MPGNSGSRFPPRVCALPGDRGVLDDALDGATVPELHPTDHGQIDLAPVQLEAWRIAEAIGQEPLMIRGRCSTTSEEIGIGPLQILETLLEDL